LTGGYNAGSLMLQFRSEAGKLASRTLFRLTPDVFSSDQQTPIVYDGFIYGVKPGGQMVCLAPDGQVRWTSGEAAKFGLGPFIIADGKIIGMNDTGMLSLVGASPDSFQLLGQARVLSGHDAWGPLALAGGRLLARDLTRLACINLEDK
jgi:outer membrane protein assembly factor BamB